jgi:hypothetical protein
MCKNKMFRWSPLLDISIYVLICVLRFKCRNKLFRLFLFVYLFVFFKYACKTWQISFYMWACQKVWQIEGGITLIFLDIFNWTKYFWNMQVKLDKFHFTCGRVKRCVKLKNCFTSWIFLQVGSFTSRILLQVGSF